MVFKMDLRHLRYFIAVAEEQSFTRAAEKLFIAQPPLSKQIKDLEYELGVELFERGSRPLKMTQAGHFFYKKSIKILENINEIKNETHRIGAIQRDFRFGFDASLLFGLLPKIVNSYRQAHPHLNIKLIEGDTSEQSSLLKEGKLDIGVIRVKANDPDIRNVLLREEPLVLAVYKDHPLSICTEGVDLNEITNEIIFLYPNKNENNFSDFIIDIFTENNLNLSKPSFVRDIQLAMGLVAAGEGVTIIPKSVNAIDFPELVFIPINGKNIKTQVYIIMKANETNPDVQAIFICTYRVYKKLNISYFKSEN